MTKEKNKVLVESLLEDFGKTVKEYRIKKGLSMQKMAEIVSISPSYVYRIEANKRRPEIGTRVRYMSNGLGFTDEEITYYLQKYFAIERVNRK